MASLLAVIGVFAAVVLLGLLRGFVLTYLWQWFVVPFGAPEIRVIHAWGISILIAFLTYELNENVDSKPSERFAKSLLASLMVFFVGWILSHFM